MTARQPARIPGEFEVTLLFMEVWQNSEVLIYGMETKHYRHTVPVSKDIEIFCRYLWMFMVLRVKSICPGRPCTNVKTVQRFHNNVAKCTVAAHTCEEHINLLRGRLVMSNAFIIQGCLQDSHLNQLVNTKNMSIL